MGLVLTVVSVSMLRLSSVTMEVKDGLERLIRQILLHHVYARPSPISIWIFTTIEIGPYILRNLFKCKVHILLIVNQVLI